MQINRGVDQRFGATVTSISIQSLFTAIGGDALDGVILSAIPTVSGQTPQSAVIVTEDVDLDFGSLLAELGIGLKQRDLARGTKNEAIPAQTPNAIGRADSVTLEPLTSRAPSVRPGEQQNTVTNDASIFETRLVQDGLPKRCPKNQVPDAGLPVYYSDFRTPENHVLNATVQINHLKALLGKQPIEHQPELLVEQIEVSVETAVDVQQHLHPTTTSATRIASAAGKTGGLTSERRKVTNLDSSSTGDMEHLQFRPEVITPNEDVSALDSFDNLVNQSDGFEQPDAAQQIASEALRHAEIVRNEGQHRFTIRLDPPELGEVVVDMVQDGTELSMHVRVAEAKTGELLQSVVDDLSNGLLGGDDSSFVNVSVDVSTGGSSQQQSENHRHPARQPIVEDETTRMPDNSEQKSDSGLVNITA